jgi:hypothetical protein
MSLQSIASSLEMNPLFPKEDPIFTLQMIKFIEKILDMGCYKFKKTKSIHKPKIKIVSELSHEIRRLRILFFQICDMDLICQMLVLLLSSMFLEYEV